MYPLPHIDTCLESIDGTTLFSTPDVRSGYYNIPIRESDRDKQPVSHEKVASDTKSCHFD